MKSLKKLLVFAAAVLTAAGVSTQARAANTTEFVEEITSAKMYKAATSDRMSAPVSLTQGGNESISTQNGSLSISATDLTLPGKAGFDFSLTRTYDSEMQNEQGLGEAGYFGDYSVTADIKLGVKQRGDDKLAVKYYDAANPTDFVYIVYEREQQMFDREDENQTIFVSANYKSLVRSSAAGNLDSNKFKFYGMSGEVAETGIVFCDALPAGNVALKRADAAPQSFYMTQQGSFGTDFTNSGTRKRSGLGLGWRMNEASLCVTSQISDGGSYYSYTGYFVDDTGSRVNFSVDNLVKREGATMQGDCFVYDDEGDVVRSVWGITATYTTNSANEYFRAQRGDGTQFVFNKTGRLLQKTDRFGNTIVYDADGGATDSYGRQITAVKEGSATTYFVDGQKVVTYELIQNHSENDPGHYFFTDDSYIFRVKKYTGDNAYTAIDYHTYAVQQQYQTNNYFEAGSNVDDEISNSRILTKYLISETSYPTGGKTQYSFHNYQIHFDTALLLRDKYRCDARWDVLAGGTEVNKITYDFQTLAENGGLGVANRLTNTEASFTKYQTGTSADYTELFRYDYNSNLVYQKITAGDSVKEVTSSNFQTMGTGGRKAPYGGNQGIFKKRAFCL